MLELECGKRLIDCLIALETNELLICSDQAFILHRPSGFYGMLEEAFVYRDDT